MAIKIWTTDIQKCFIWTTPVKSIWSWDTQVRPSWWQPWVNTIAYYPLTSTTTTSDESGNWHTLYNNSVQFGTYNWVDCANCNWSAYLYRSESLFTWNQDFTVNFWFRRTGSYSSNWNIMTVGKRNNPNCWISWIKPQTWTLYNGWWSNDRDTWYLVPQDARLNIVYSYSNNNISIYVNWVSYYNGWVSYGIKTGYTAIWCWVNYENPVIWNFSNVIFENVWWIAQEVADYYNQTKANYGL